MSMTDHFSNNAALYIQVI